MKRKKRCCDRCRNKVRYPDQGRAFAAANGLARYVGLSWRVYACPHGNGWHLTTQPQKTEVRR